MLEKTGEFIVHSANVIWGTPLLIPLLGVGLSIFAVLQLALHVKRAATDYFSRLQSGQF